MRLREWLGIGERRWKKAPDEEVQPAKTLWDWLQLLIVPAILVGVTFAWSATQTRSDNKREDRRIAADRVAAEEARQDTTLQTYLNQMSELMLDKNLLTPEKNLAVRPVARTITLATIRRLDGARNAEVITFLKTAGLLELLGDGADLRDVVLTDVDLSTADLSRADFRGADLTRADLSYADLTDANLTDADLTGADLTYANLTEADLSRVHLMGAVLKLANLTYADLTDADLTDADVTFANLSDAVLRGADLRDADLENSYLIDADLSHAYLVGANLKGASSLDLRLYLAELPQDELKQFLDLQEEFLDSLSSAELAEFNLSPERLARFRREARGA